MAILLTLVDGVQMVTESSVDEAIGTGRGTTRVWFANGESHEVIESPQEIMSKLEAWYSLKNGGPAALEQY